MIRLRATIALSLVSVTMGAAVGCRPAAVAAKAAPPPPEVIVAVGIQQEYVPTEEFTGRLAASEEVDIRARVTGHLDKVLFTDGATVRKGDPLFVIDPRTYESELMRVNATIGQSKARVDRIARQVDRAKQLLASRAISSEEAELLEFDRAEALAALRVAEANKELAELQVGFTTVTSPVDGQIGRHLIDAGNMVAADTTSLAHIVSLNPIYAYFVVDERTVLKFRRALPQGESLAAAKKKWSLELALLDESETSVRGEIDFIDNELDADTGTLAFRAIIPNDDLRLLPGFFVRCRMAMGEKRTGLCVPEEALVTDQGQRHLYVLNADDEVEYRRVTLGPLLEKLRVIESGLESGERVVVAGQQRVRPGQKVAIAKNQ